jgi:hypothetical protein
MDVETSDEESIGHEVMIARGTPATPDACPNLLKISESAFCVGLRLAACGLAAGAADLISMKRPLGNIRRPPGLKIACFQKCPFAPVMRDLHSQAERGASKLLFHQRNKGVVAARAHIPYRGYAASDC